MLGAWKKFESDKWQRKVETIKLKGKKQDPKVNGLYKKPTSNSDIPIDGSLT